MSNNLLAGPSIPNNVSARIKCPVEETGKNSVSPSIIPSRAAVR
jgi:hypothetical protein